MSTIAPATAVVGGADRARRRRQVERRATSQAFWSALGVIWSIGLWFWGIFTLVQVVTTSVIARFLEDADGEIVISAGPVGSPQIFLFVMGIVTAAGLLTLHVSAGGTRRSAVRGWLLAAPAVGVTFAVAGLLLTALVRWIASFAADRWGSSVAGYGTPPFEGAPAAALALAILGTATFLTGVAVNAVYRRLGGWWGTLALPLVLAPALLAHGALLLGGDTRGGVPGPGTTAAGWLLSLPCLAAAALLMHLLVRRLPID